MSDSHGNRDIVQELKDYYRGKVDAIFHNGDSELSSSDPIWQGIEVVEGNCVYGHLHAAAVEKRGKTVFLNPGSVQQPRGPIQVKLYALVTFTDENISVRFYSLDHQEFSLLTKEFPR